MIRSGLGTESGDMLRSRAVTPCQLPRPLDLRELLPQHEELRGASYHDGMQATVADGDVSQQEADELEIIWPKNELKTRRWMRAELTGSIREVAYVGSHSLWTAYVDVVDSCGWPPRASLTAMPPRCHPRLIDEISHVLLDRGTVSMSPAQQKEERLRPYSVNMILSIVGSRSGSLKLRRTIRQNQT